MLYVLAFPKFAETMARSIDRFRALHEPERARLVGPHVTLVFALSEADADGVCDSCGRAAAQTPPMDIAFDHVEIGDDPYEKTHKIFMLCSTGSGALVALHRRLYRGLHREGDAEYRPHMTIATNAARERLEHLDPASIGAFPVRAVVDAIDVVQITGGALETVRTIPFSA
ncbi:2'-5' RNA ligase family protein [Acuticoccus sediminis]|nr:2'-5' RNA ligase family protein [Acuticoccus sediminis]